jgi:ubiquinone/menaquinone biosynthesis C-methylase UbiE
MNNWKLSAISHFDNEHLGKDCRVKTGLWPNSQGQILRFDALIGIGDLNNCTILDVGCGAGDLDSYIKEQNTLIKSYSGIDIHPSLVKHANKINPNLNIIEGDILKNDFSDNEFDFVVASGIFNFILDDWNDRTLKIVEEMYRISSQGVGVNFLRWRDSDRNPVSYYAKIGQVADIVNKISSKYVIRADYKSNDFTVYLFK